MKEQSGALPEEGPEGVRNPIGMAQSEFTGERPSWKARQDVRWVPSKGMQQQHWESQWQEFLKTLQSPHSAWGSPQVAEETTLWDDAKAFLASFEQVAQACQWPREEWVVRLLPALSGEAQQAFGSLEARDREDYGKLKAAILRGEASRMETLRQHFRQFRSREVEDPRRIYSQLQELCCQWLRPERHSKEQILELLILEQFLAILPPELQSWIRAGGPENCIQAAALVDDFLLSQQKVETWKWQEPLQGLIRGSPAEEGAPSDFGQRPAVKETKQNSNRDAGLLGSGMRCPSDSEISLPSKEQETTRAGPTEAPVTLKETSMSVHVVEPALAKPSQRTMFWQVMQEDEGNADSLEGLLVPKSDLASHLEKDDEMFVQFPEESERLPGRDPGLKKRSRIKMEGSRQGEAGPEETQGAAAEISQWNFPATAEIHVPRCDEKRNQFQVEEKFQQGEIGTEETPRMLVEIARWNFPTRAEIYKERCESRWEQGKEGKERSERTEGGAPADSETSVVRPRARRSTMSKYSRRHPCGSGRVMKESYLEQHQTTQDRGKHYEHPEGGKNFGDLKKVTTHQRIITGKKPSLESGKIHRLLSVESERTRTGENPFRCPQCGLSFCRKRDMKWHQTIHTGEKPFGCSHCSQSFNQRSDLVRHQRIHTGEKPYQCHECKRNFSRRDKLIEHQSTHAGGKRCDEKRSQIKVENWQQVELGPEEAQWTLAEISPWESPVTADIYEQRCKYRGDRGTKPAEEEHGCSEIAFTASVIGNSAVSSRAKKPLVSRYGRRYHCRSGFVIDHAAEDFEHPISGDNLQPKSYLVKHQMIQMGERSYVCSECGKSFHLRSNLLRHQKVHTGENPYECPVCGKSFTSRGAVMVHQIIHTGEKPFGCPQCGKWFNQRTNLLRHQRIHTGEKVHECPKCGKNFYRRDKLNQHQRIHTREKRYECPECGKSFIHKEKFLRHQRIHRGF